MITEAVVKLMWILGISNDPNKVKQLFYTTIDQDILLY